MLKDYITKDTKFNVLKKEFNIRNIYINECLYDDELLMHFFIDTGINMATASHLIGDWYKIDNKWYLFKKDSDSLFTNFSLNELLGEVITKYFELDAAHYEIAMTEDNDKTIGLITKNFHEEDAEYDSPINYFSSANREGIKIFNYLKELSEKDEKYKPLLTDIKKLFIRDFFTGEKDRENINLLFKEKDNMLFLAPIFDNEECFFKNNSKMEVYSNCLGQIDITKRATKDLLTEDDYFQYLLDRLMKFNMNDALSIIEEHNNILIPNEDKDNYIRHTNKIKELVKENNLIKKL